MSPKQEYRDNSPYICACNFHLIFTHMHKHNNFDGVSLQNRDQDNNHIYISEEIKEGLASKTTTGTRTSHKINKARS
jgi:hypothetical protein